MSEKKYIFNPETLNYEHSSRSKIKKIAGIIIFQFVAAITVAIIIFIGFSYVIETPKQKKLKKEIELLDKQYNSLVSKREQQKKFLTELEEKDKALYREIFQSNPEIDSTFLNDAFIEYDNINIRKINKENKKQLEELIEKLKEQEQEYNRVINLAETQKNNLKQIPAIQPLYNKDLRYHVAGFGKKIDQLYKSPVFHPGIDYAAPEGTKVFATADGVVVQADIQRKYGKQILIKHDDKYKTRYAHLSEISVSIGQRIKRGDEIGKTGNTGKSLIPHLHYEVIYQGNTINPVNYFFLDLNPEEYSKIKYMADKTGLSLD